MVETEPPEEDYEINVQTVEPGPLRSFADALE
jgi:hypothetical protein